MNQRLSDSAKNDRALQFWTVWLLVAHACFSFVGLLVAFAGNSFFFLLHNQATRSVFFSGAELPPEVLPYKQFLYGIIGGTIAGFHALSLFVVQYGFRAGNRWAWNALAASLLIWFAIDSGLSMAHGAAFNVYLINLPALAGGGIPLLFSWRFFR
jgi:hypothetical protein